MAIHRWGEGVWARGIAFAIVATFIIWGAFDFYNVPKAASVIVEKGGVVDAKVIDELMAHRVAEQARPQFPVNGFANQDCDPKTLAGKQVDANIISPTRGKLASQGDELKEEQVKSFIEAGIERVPIVGENKRPVDNTLIGAVTAEPVATLTKPVLWDGQKLTADQLEETYKKLENADPPIGQGGRKLRNAAGAERAWTQIKDLQPGDIALVPVEGKAQATVLFEAEKNITAADITTLKEAGITQIAVRSTGMIYLDAAMGGPNYSAKTYAKFYFTAGETRNKKTWWTAQVWEIPLFGWSLTGGGIVCIVVMLALLILAWNYLNRPKLVDLLIETQLEMKKVSWPKGRELASSSIVVMAFIIFVAAWLAIADYIFLWLASLIGVYGGK